jgi:hypothetical protein
VFLTKNFKERNKRYILEFFQNVRNIEIHNSLDIIDIFKICGTYQMYFLKIYKNVHLSVSYDFSKFVGSKKIKV